MNHRVVAIGSVAIALSGAFLWQHAFSSQVFAKAISLSGGGELAVDYAEISLGTIYRRELVTSSFELTNCSVESIEATLRGSCSCVQAPKSILLAPGESKELSVKFRLPVHFGDFSEQISITTARSSEPLLVAFNGNVENGPRPTRWESQHAIPVSRMAELRSPMRVGGTGLPPNTRIDRIVSSSSRVFLTGSKISEDGQFECDLEVVCPANARRWQESLLLVFGKEERSVEVLIDFLPKYTIQVDPVILVVSKNDDSPGVRVFSPWERNIDLDVETYVKGPVSVSFSQMQQDESEAIGTVSVDWNALDGRTLSVAFDLMIGGESIPFRIVATEL